MLFVGAGASIAPPSNLPTFQGLTANIAAEAGVPLDDKQLDRFLGMLKDWRDIDVHGRVAAKIGKKPSAPEQVARGDRRPRRGYLRLPALVKQLRELLGPAADRGIVEEALRLDYPGAADW